jgi:uncharacterized integral membrane protein
MSVLPPNQTELARPVTSPPADVALARDGVGLPEATRPSPGASPTDPVDPNAVTATGRPRRTRISNAWLAVWTAAIASVVLIVFMLQNTGTVEISFLWMHGNVPLALSLLTAGVGVAIVAIAIGQARIGQLRRAARRRG